VEGKSITDRASSPPFMQDVPVFLDGYAKGNSVQGQLDKLMSLGGEDGAVFRAFGPIHRSGIRYVYGGEPEFGETIRDNDGTLLRQRLTLRLMEYVPPDVVRLRRKRKKKKPSTGGTSFPGNRYTTKSGDTLVKIAAKLYGDWRRWRQIAQKNGLRDPNKSLKPGTTLKLP
jgi:hypothetical protein